jgi:hypothetical protein
MLDALIRTLSPGWALSRSQARLAEQRLAEITARYEHSVLHAILDPGAYVYGQWDEAPSAV